MKTAGDFIKDQLNINRLSPLQWDGILRAMQLYADQAVNADRESRWVSVDERLPEMRVNLNYSNNVHAWCDGQLMIMCLCEVDHKYLWANCYNDPNGDGDLDDNYEVTHWQPLPPKPNE